MKRLLTIILSIVVACCLLFVIGIGVLSILDVSFDFPEREDKRIEISSKYITEENGTYTLTLPQSKQTIKFSNDQKPFVAYVTDELVEFAEEKIIEEFGDDDFMQEFYLYIVEDYLCLCSGGIKQIIPPETIEVDGTYIDRECGVDHEHLYLSERISTKALKD